jgi:hypothetical protein
MSINQFNLTEKQLKEIKMEANKELHKRFPMLGNDTIDYTHIIYVLEAYKKVIKKGGV